MSVHMFACTPNFPCVERDSPPGLFPESPLTDALDTWPRPHAYPRMQTGKFPFHSIFNASYLVSQ